MRLPISVADCLCFIRSPYVPGSATVDSIYDHVIDKCLCLCVYMCNDPVVLIISCSVVNLTPCTYIYSDPCSVVKVACRIPSLFHRHAFSSKAGRTSSNPLSSNLYMYTYYALRASRSSLFISHSTDPHTFPKRLNRSKATKIEEFNQRKENMCSQSTCSTCRTTLSHPIPSPHPALSSF